MGRWTAAAMIVSLWLLSLAGNAAGDNTAPLADYDQVILDVQLNLLKQGTVFCLLSPDGSDVWVREDEFQSLGLNLPTPQRQTHEGIDYLRLHTQPGLRSELDLITLTLVLEADPELLGKQIISLQHNEHLDSDYQQTLHGYLNYSLGLGSMKSGNTSRNAALQFNLAQHGWLLRSHHILNSDDTGSERLRLETSLSRDLEQHMARLSLGDVTAQSGLFGQSRPLAGLSLSRNYRINPALNTAPGLAFYGAAHTRATAEVYVDGAKLHSVELQPGLYELNDLYYFAGLRNVELVIRDAYGEQQSLPLNHYFSSSNLRAGLSDFNYALGAPRRSLSLGGGYDGWMVSGQHRYGITDELTTGLRGEALEDYHSYGATTTLTLGQRGVLDGALSHSDNQRHRLSGNAFNLGYSFSRHTLAYSANYLQRSTGFGVLPETTDLSQLPQQLHSQLSGSIGRSLGRGQNISFNLAAGRRQDGVHTALQSVRYSWQIDKGLNLTTALSHQTDGDGSAYSGWLGLSWNLDRQQTITTQIERDRKGEVTESARYSHAVPMNSGLGGATGISRNTQSQTLETNAQYNTHHAAYTFNGHYQQNDTSDSNWASEARMTGAVAWMDHSLFASRSITGSFGVVSIDGLPDVRVYQNNQYVGSTNHAGKLLLPNLMAYGHNQIRVDDRDIPFDRSLNQVNRDAIPRADMGLLIPFSAKPLRAVGGELHDSNDTPIRSVALRLYNPAFTLESFTGPDGDFYFENLDSGHYQLETLGTTTPCSAALELKDDQPPFTDLGTLNCREHTDAP